METQIEKKTLKQKLFHELSEYFINTIYLALFFCGYAISRRLILAQYGIYLDDYFVGIIKALIIAKVIMLAGFLRVSRLFEGKPLIIPVLYKTLIFVAFSVLFDVLEDLVRYAINNHSLAGAFDNLVVHHFSKMWLGGVLMLTISFIPFFALKELSRVMGEAKFRELFYKKGTIA